MSGVLVNIYDNVSFALSRHSKAMAVLQEQASTGSRINRTSDDPSSGYQVLGLKSEERFLQNYMDLIEDTSGSLEIVSTVLESIVSDINDARLQITQIVGGIYGETERQRTADVLNDILEQIVSLANTQHNNRYLFSGNNSDTTPYAVTRTNGDITAVTYNGGSSDRVIEAAPGVDVTSNYAGDDLFGSDARQAPVFTGDSGAAAGTGTSSVRGDVWLTISEPASGTYRLSIDDGASYVDVSVPPGDANTKVTDSVTGRILYVDTTSITSTGVELVQNPGTYNVFNSLMGLRDILRNERGFSDSEVVDLINDSVSSLEEVRDLVIGNQVIIGSKIGFLENISTTLNDINYNASQQVSLLEEADITQVAIDLSRREVLYQMSLSVAGKLMSMSLLNYLQ